jgi:hypothetical protein
MRSPYEADVVIFMQRRDGQVDRYAFAAGFLAYGLVRIASLYPERSRGVIHRQRGIPLSF